MFRSKKALYSQLQKQLKDNYEYDSEGYAIWNFRTGMQDGPRDISKVTSVTAWEMVYTRSIS